ncbi:MAG TPA: hypothetical protein VFX95_08690, partial [Caulobacteraceae bacterium]|nr:hypothetical protein [Caulobacteraceae bacterium]
WVIALLMAREKDRAPPLWLAAVMVLWANLHGSYVFGLVLIGPMALEALIAAAPERRLEVVWRWGLFGVLSLLAALVTPHGVEGLIFPFTVMTMTSLPEIIEWQPTNFQKNRLVEYAILGALFAVLTRGVRVPVLRVLVLLGLFHLMLQHARHALVMGVISPLLLAKPLGEALEPNYRPQMRLRWKPLLAIGLVAVLGATAVRAVNPLVRRTGYNAPIDALEAVPADLRAKPVYNNYGLGGYLIFKGVKVFIDGRADMYGDAYLKNYLRIGRGDSAALDKAIAQYGIEWMMLAPNSGVANRMAKKPGWRKLYGDKIAVVYVRDDYGRSASAPSSTTR